MSSTIHLLAFPDHVEADLRVQLGRLLPSTRIESHGERQADFDLGDDEMVFVWDGMLTPSWVSKLFAQ